MPASEERAPAARLFVHLFDEVEEHDDVADNDSMRLATPRNAMNPKGVPIIARQSTPRLLVWRCRKHEQGLDGILELHEQCQVDAQRERSGERRRIRKSIDLLRFLAGDLQLISGRKLALKIL